MFDAKHTPVSTVWEGLAFYFRNTDFLTRLFTTTGLQCPGVLQRYTVNYNLFTTPCVLYSRTL